MTGKVILLYKIRGRVLKPKAGSAKVELVWHLVCPVKSSDPIICQQAMSVLLFVQGFISMTKYD